MRQSDIPAFITVRDRLDPLKQLLRWLTQSGHSDIWLVDNASTYPPLVEFLKSCSFNVVFTGKNLGHRAPWLSGVVQRQASDRPYILTDPDVVPSEECPSDAALYLWELLRKYPDVSKAGLGLRIDDLPRSYPLRDDVKNWESQFWISQRESGVFEADIDTTFAVYRPYTGLQSHHPCLRTDFPYVARHLPWYQDPNDLSEEDLYYRTHASSAISNWDRERVAIWKERLMQRG